MFPLLFAWQRVHGYNEPAPLKWLKLAKMDNAWITRWALVLQSFQFSIEYKLGKSNVVDDFLSRCHSREAPEMSQEHQGETSLPAPSAPGNKRRPPSGILMGGYVRGEETTPPDSPHAPLDCPITYRRGSDGQQLQQDTKTAGSGTPVSEMPEPANQQQNWAGPDGSVGHSKSGQEHSWRRHGKERACQ